MVVLTSCMLAGVGSVLAAKAAWHALHTLMTGGQCLAAACYLS